MRTHQEIPMHRHFYGVTFGVRISAAPTVAFCVASTVRGVSPDEGKLTLSGNMSANICLISKEA